MKGFLFVIIVLAMVSFMGCDLKRDITGSGEYVLTDTLEFTPSKKKLVKTQNWPPKFKFILVISQSDAVFAKTALESDQGWKIENPTPEPEILGKTWSYMYMAGQYVDLTQPLELGQYTYKAPKKKEKWKGDLNYVLD